MKTLELRDGETKKKVEYVKVVNPNNPKEFIYCEANLFNSIVAGADEGLSGFWDKVWGGVKGAVGGLVTGGPIGAIGGAVVGFTQTSTKKPAVAVSPQANGQQQLTITAPSQALVPATVLPPKQDNTLLYLSLGTVGALLIAKAL